MKKINVTRESYIYELTPLTPIHIGNGNELYPWDYVVKDGEYFRVDTMEVYEKVSLQEKVNFQKEIQKGIIKFRSYFNRIYKKEYGYFYKGKVSQEFEEKYQAKLKGAGNPNEENKLMIKEFIGISEGKYIPGSTIKGAIRTGFLSENGEGYISYNLMRKPNPKTRPFTVSDKNLAKEIEIKILGLQGDFEPKADPFKYIKVGDTEIVEELVRVSEISRVGGKSDITQFLEVTDSLFSTGNELKIPFRMEFRSITEGALKSAFTKSNPISEEKDLFQDIIFENLNARAEKILEEDLKFFRKIGNKDAERVTLEIQKILKSLDSENETLIRIGQGVGFNTTTLILDNERRKPEKDEPKTRMLVDKKYPLGWAIIKKALVTT